MAQAAHGQNVAACARRHRNKPIVHPAPADLMQLARAIPDLRSCFKDSSNLHRRKNCLDCTNRVGTIGRIVRSTVTSFSDCVPARAETNQHLSSLGGLLQLICMRIFFLLSIPWHTPHLGGIAWTSTVGVSLLLHLLLT